MLEPITLKIEGKQSELVITGNLSRKIFNSLVDYDSSTVTWATNLSSARTAVRKLAEFHKRVSVEEFEADPNKETSILLRYLAEGVSGNSKDETLPLAALDYKARDLRASPNFSNLRYLRAQAPYAVLTINNRPLRIGVTSHVDISKNVASLIMDTTDYHLRFEELQPKLSEIYKRRIQRFQ